MHTDRIKAVYAFAFTAVEILGHASLPTTAEEAETWQAMELLELAELQGVDIDVDVIDPIVDRTLKPDGVGPDGRIEFSNHEPDEPQNDRAGPIRLNRQTGSDKWIACGFKLPSARAAMD